MGLGTRSRHLIIMQGRKKPAFLLKGADPMLASAEKHFEQQNFTKLIRLTRFNADDMMTKLLLCSEWKQQLPNFFNTGFDKQGTYVMCLQFKLVVSISGP